MFRNYLLLGCVLWLGLPPNGAVALGLCAKAATHAGRQIDAPDLLLPAISLAETGKYDPATGKTEAWPWTVTAEGKGRYLASKEEAVREVEYLQAKGVRNIDVGCMQINLHYHPDAFDTLHAAFDPNTNAAYSAFFLSQLHKESGSWTRAAAHYHSRTKRLAANYKAKVITLWRQLARAEAIAKAKSRTRGPKPGISLTKRTRAQNSQSGAVAANWREQQVTRYLERKGRNNQHSVYR